MAVIVKYDDTDLISGGIGDIVNIAQDAEHVSLGERTHIEHRIVVNGHILGCESNSATDQQNFDKLIENKTAFLGRLEKNFKKLEIEEGAETILEREFVIIDDISFPDSKYTRVLPFSITFVTRPESLFKRFFGITDASDEWSYSEQRDGLVEVSHTVSATGFNTNATNNNALSNAESFVKARLSTEVGVTPISPYFIVLPQLKRGQPNIAEEINRLNATYTVTETYTLDEGSLKAEILRYTINISKPGDEFIQLDISGSFQGNRSQTMDAIRESFSGISFKDIAIERYDYIEEKDDLNEEPLSQSITDVENQRLINFSFSFDNNPNPLTHIDYNVSISELDERIEVTLSGEIHGRGELNTRWTNVQTRFDEINPFNLASTEYFKHFPDWPLNDRIISQDVTFNKFSGSISFTYNFDNEDKAPEGFDEFSYTANFTPALRQVRENYILDGNGEYSVTDLGYENRAGIVIQGSGVFKTGLTQNQRNSRLRDALNFAILEFGNFDQLRLRQESISQDRTNNLRVNFSIAWDFNADNKVLNVNSDYKTIVNLLPKDLGS